MRIFSATILGSSLLLCGCATTQEVPPPDYSFNRAPVRGSVQSKRAVVLPTLVTASMGADWDALCERVDREIISYLQTQGYDATLVEVDELSGRHIQSDGFDQGPYSLPEVLEAQLSDLEPDLDADLVVVPNLKFQPTVLEYPYKRSAWDGVQREVRENAPGSGRWLSNTQISLNVRIKDTDENSILSGYGGLDLAQKTVFEKRGKGGVRHLVAIQSEDVADTFVSESVQLAFHPMIPVQGLE